MAQIVTLTANQLAAIADVSVDTVARRLAEAAIRPTGKRGPYPVYNARAALRVLASYLVSADAVDPARLPPLAQKTFWQAQNERMRAELRAGQLVERDDVETEIAGLTKIFVRTLDTLPDLIERNCGAPPNVVAEVERAIDSVRTELAERLARDEPIEVAA